MDFWQNHGSLFFPHLTVTVLATTYCWDKHPVLCVIAWLVAFGGTAGERQGRVQADEEIN